MIGFLVALALAFSMVYFVTTLRYNRTEWPRIYSRFLHARGESIEEKSPQQIESARCAWIVLHWSLVTGLLFAVALLPGSPFWSLLVGAGTGIGSLAITYHVLMRQSDSVSR